MSRQAPARILMLQTASTQHGGLDTAEEHRQARQAVQGARYGEHLYFEVASAARPPDLLDHLQRFLPIVLHFSGHCSQDGGLRFRTDDGGDAPAVSEGLVRVIEETGIVLAVLNGCFTSPLAKALADVTGSATGYLGRVSDIAAIDFARELYRSIGYGLSVGAAFRMARAAMQTFGASESELPELHTHAAIDADALFLIPPEFLTPLPRDSVKPNAVAYMARNRKPIHTGRAADPPTFEHRITQYLISTEHIDTDIE